MKPFIAIAAGCFLCVPAALAADAPVKAPALIAVIIDDLGNTTLEEGRRVAALPGPVACAILPHTTHGVLIAKLAHKAGKEVLLHLPLEPVGELPLGPGAVTLDMTEQEIKDTVRDDLLAIPHVTGFNNHEGSLITQHPGDMAWIMQAVHAAGAYFYIDSYTTTESVAYQVAREQGVPAARRNVFLDDENTVESVRAQWARLLKIAREHGFAIAIGHPRGATLTVLEDELPQLAAQGVELVPVARIVALQEAHPLPPVVTITSAPQATTNQKKK
jgi:polysaccharide deacetylase 2 family uncharacterized protein YibQ